MSNNIQIKSLHQIIEQLEKRLEHLEVKGKVGDFKYNLQFLLLMPVSQDYVDYSVYGSTSLHDILMIHGEWPEESTLLNMEWTL